MKIEKASSEDDQLAFFWGFGFFCCSGVFERQFQGDLSFDPLTALQYEMIMIFAFWDEIAGSRAFSFLFLLSGSRAFQPCVTSACYLFLNESLLVHQITKLTKLKFEKH